MHIACPLCTALHELPDKSRTSGLTQGICHECNANLVFVGRHAHGSGPRAAEGRAGTGRGRLLGITALLILSIFNYALLGASVFGLQYSIKNSEAYKVSESFLREHEDIRRTVGGPIEFGFFPNARMQSNSHRTTADFDIGVKGSSGSTDVSMSLLKEEGNWRIVKATYSDESGNIQSLLRDTQILPLPTKAQPLLKKEHVETLLEAYGQAVNQKNLEGILVHMAKDMTFKATIQSTSDTATVTFTRSEYRQRLHQTYAAAKAYIFVREETAITIAPDGKSAKVEFQMFEHTTFSREAWQVRGTEVMRIELRGGRPVITRVELIGKTEKV